MSVVYTKAKNIKNRTFSTIVLRIKLMNILRTKLDRDKYKQLIDQAKGLLGQ